MTSLLSIFHDSSRIDYLAHFGNAWIGFNEWYNQHAPNPDAPEVVRIRESVAGQLEVIAAFAEQMASLNTISDHIDETLDQLSTITYSDNAGNPVTHGRDVTGAKLRLRCNNNNVVTQFLDLCRHNPNCPSNVSATCHGIRLFNHQSRQDELFKAVYVGYKQSRYDNFNNARCFSFDALAHIPDNLEKLGVQAFGRLLYHDFSLREDSTCIYSMDQVYDAGYEASLQALNQPNRDLTDEQKEVKYLIGKPLYQVVLTALYKVRCAYFHGELSPNEDINQELGEYAYKTLRFFMDAIITAESTAGEERDDE